MSWFPLFLDISATTKGRRRYLWRVVSFLRPESNDPIKAAQDDFKGFGKHLLTDFREMIYSDLNVIDGKTNTVMQLNAILVVVYSIAYSNLIEGKFHPTKTEVAALIMSIILSSLAILLLLTCVFIRWETYKVTETNVERDMMWLIKLRDSRTWRYRLAWCANFASILIFMFLIVNNYDAIVSIGFKQ
jgi:hypothetical protein